MSCLVLEGGVGHAEYFWCRVFLADRNLVLLWYECRVLLARVAEELVREVSLGFAARICRGPVRRRPQLDLYSEHVNAKQGVESSQKHVSDTT